MTTDSKARVGLWVRGWRGKLSETTTTITSNNWAQRGDKVQASMQCQVNEKWGSFSNHGLHLGVRPYAEPCLHPPIYSTPSLEKRT